MNDRDRAAQALVVLRRRVDDHFDGALHRSPGAMQCHEGCEGCCHVRLSVFSIEAERIATALADLAARDPARRQAVRRQADDPAHGQRCPMLVDGRCAIYAERPLICRSHGLPVATASDDTTIDVRWCALNFTRSSPPRPSVLRLEALNEPLSVMARMWDADARRVELAVLARTPERAGGRSGAR